jgi:hypothetical protein
MRATEFLPNLPAAVACETLNTLHATLPPPAVDTPENRDARDATAMAELAALRPADRVELMVATQIVLAEAHAAACLRLAARPGMDFKTASRSRSLAASFLRCSQDERRFLLRRQAARVQPKAGKQPAPAPRTSPWLRDTAHLAASTAPRPATNLNQTTDLTAEARQQRAARIRALDLRVIDIPMTRH